jgi:Leucine Rich repeat
LRCNRIGDDGAAAIAHALTQNQTLTTIWLDGNQNGDVGMEALAQALIQNTSLRGLHLDKNRFGTAGLTALANALKEAIGLSAISLNNNSVGSEGATILADVLKINATLTELWLENNSIGDVGAAALADALKCNSTLIVVSLDNNSIGDVGAAALAAALKSNATLTRLWLGNNSVSDVGAAALADALKSNATLAVLDLYNNNNTGDVGARAFLDALTGWNTTLTDMRIAGISRSIRSAIQEMLEANGAKTRSAALTNTSHAPTSPSQSDSLPPPTQAQALPTPPAVATTPETKSPTSQGPAATFSTPTRKDSSAEDSASNKLGSECDLPTQRAELEFEIQRLAVVRDACMDTPDEDQWEESVNAEERIRQMKNAIASGKYPTSAELERMVETLTKDIREKVQNESVAAAKPLRERLAQLQADLQREREAETRVSKIANKDIDNESVAAGRQAVLLALRGKNPTDHLSQIPLDYLAIITNDWKEKIGSGGFGEVYKGNDSKSAVAVAVKTIPSDRFDESEKENFRKEMEVRLVFHECVGSNVVLW